MATITNKRAAPISISYSVEGVIHDLFLTSGVNLGVPDDHVEYLRKHQSFAGMLEKGIVDIVKSAPSSKGNLGGFEVTENKLTDEPIPIISAKISKAA